jgi:hypothetical protein
VTAKDVVNEKHPVEFSLIIAQYHGHLYIDTTDCFLCYSRLSSTAADEITEIKRRLKDAHLGLEKLGTRFRGLPTLKEVMEATRKMWKIYTQLEVLEEGC